jgi:hypothetical protein
VFPEVDKQISWEGHLAGLITGFLFAAYYETPDYVVASQYPWEKPDFNPEEDPFMKRFDAEGNFVNPPPETIEEVVEEEVYTPSYVYVFKETTDDTPSEE